MRVRPLSHGIALSINVLLFCLIPLLSGNISAPDKPAYTLPQAPTIGLATASNHSRTQRNRPAERVPKEVPKTIPRVEPLTVTKPEISQEVPKPRIEVNPEIVTGIRLPPPPKPKPKKEVVKKPEVQPVKVARSAPAAPPSATPSSPGSSAAHSASVAGAPNLAPVPTEFQVDEVDEPPRLIRKVPPHYPYSARQRKITGEVVVRFLVDKHGKVAEVTIQDSRPRGVFDRSVLSAVRKWQFKPGRYQGEAVPTWVMAPVVFELGG